MNLFQCLVKSPHAAMLTPVPVLHANLYGRSFVTYLKPRLSTRAPPHHLLCLDYVLCVKRTAKTSINSTKLPFSPVNSDRRPTRAGVQLPPAHLLAIALCIVANVVKSSGGCGLSARRSSHGIVVTAVTVYSIVVAVSVSSCTVRRPSHCASINAAPPIRWASNVAAVELGRKAAVYHQSQIVRTDLVIRELFKSSFPRLRQIDNLHHTY